MIHIVNRERICIYGAIVLVFAIPIGIFIFLVVSFLPSRIAVMLLGLVGFTVMTVGPFLAIGLETKLRDKFGKKEKSS
ncbi:MAG: hypothetical protein KKH94_00975 [Candidatus Omnitrophica bacterium]|nr:hypothetical protein [Candidatus Omnitrophota bacterium]